MKVRKFRKKSKSWSSQFVFIGLFMAAMLAWVLSSAAERYSATVEDGTPKELEASQAETHEHEDEVSADQEHEDKVIDQVSDAESDLALEQNVQHQEIVEPVHKEQISLKTPENPCMRAEKKTSQPREVAVRVDNRIYDRVPKKRIPEIAKRLKYANDILKRFGRAYDYRTTTLKELKKVLASLEKSKK